MLNNATGSKAMLSVFHSSKKPLCLWIVAGVAKLADAPDLGSGAARRGGSSPFTRTNKKGSEKSDPFFYFLCFLAFNHLYGVCSVVNLNLVRTALD